MKEHLNALAAEQISRAITLKTLIQLPIKSPYLLRLFEHCTQILDGQIASLKRVRAQLVDEDPDVRRIHRKIRTAAKNISVVEYYGISSLRYQTADVDFLNGVVFKIGGEISLPIPSPSVSCLSNDYFYFEPVTGVIYVPLAETDFLLHWPDLYHEIGHSLLHASSASTLDPRLQTITEVIETIASEVTKHFRKLITESSMNPGPQETPMLLERIHAMWKTWLNEFLADLFAVFTLGPAFVWSNLHLVAEKSDNVYQSSWFSNDSHPAHEARMRLTLHALELIGFSEEARQIKERWIELTRGLDSPDPYYQDAYSDSLLTKTSRLFLEALNKTGLSMAKPVLLEGIDAEHPRTVRGLLNKAWRVFWKMNPDVYREWELHQIADMRKRVVLHDNELSSENHARPIESKSRVL